MLQPLLEEKIKAEKILHEQQDSNVISHASCFISWVCAIPNEVYADYSIHEDYAHTKFLCCNQLYMKIKKTHLEFA